MMSAIDDIALLPEPDAEWAEKIDGLLKNPWLARKVDRQRRLNEHFQYLQTNVPELLGRNAKQCAKELVIDVGPGPGEMLEIMREYGYSVLGVDAKNGDGGMGSSYLEYSRLMTKRQKIPVTYLGFERWVMTIQEDPFYTSRIIFVNFRGSIEQAFSKYMVGEAHHIHHDCKRLFWRVTAQLREIMEYCFAQLYRMMRSGGIVLIHANGSGNDGEYDELVRDAADKADFKLLFQQGLLLHKWGKE